MTVRIVKDRIGKKDVSGAILPGQPGYLVSYLTRITQPQLPAFQARIRTVRTPEWTAPLGLYIQHPAPLQVIRCNLV